MSNILCACGKIRCASEDDARRQCALEAKLHGKNPEKEVGRSRFYECDDEDSVWHWTLRGEWLSSEDFAEQQKRQCKCAGKGPKFLKDQSARRYKKRLPEIEGLSVRLFKCPSSKVIHVEYFLEEQRNVCTRCNRTIYTAYNAKRLMKILKKQNENTDRCSALCKAGHVHVISTVVD